MQIMLRPTKTGKSFRLTVNGKAYYCSMNELMFLAYGEVDSVVFRTWEQVCQRQGTDPLRPNHIHSFP